MSMSKSAAESNVCSFLAHSVGSCSSVIHGGVQSVSVEVVMSHRAAAQEFRGLDEAASGPGGMRHPNL